jgi:hypothetical protein
VLPPGAFFVNMPFLLSVPGVENAAPARVYRAGALAA